MSVYNTRPFVQCAIESILGQSFKDFDLTLWDDGSTDGSREILDHIAREHSNVQVFGGHHQGVAASLKSAIQTSRGEYIGCVDSDDLLAPTALAETVKFLDQNPSVGVVYTDHYQMNQAGTKVRLGELTKIPYSRERLLTDFVTFHFRLMR